MKAQKIAGEERIRNKIVLTTGLFLWCISTSVHALYIDIDPENPTINDSVSIYSWTSFSYTERYYLVNTTYSITGYDISIEVVMEDRGYGLAIPWAGGGTVQIGTLDEGYYSVTADMYMIPFGGSIPEFYESGSTSFDVVPEPSTLLLFAVGMVGVRAKYRKKSCQYNTGKFETYPTKIKGLSLFFI